VSVALAQAAVVKAEAAYRGYETAMLAFRVGLLRRDYKVQEAERECAVERLGEYLDQLMIANRQEG